MAQKKKKKNLTEDLKSSKSNSPPFQLYATPYVIKYVQITFSLYLHVPT